MMYDWFYENRAFLADLIVLGGIAILGVLAVGIVIIVELIEHRNDRNGGKTHE
jgi:hypothetical protein